MRSVLWNLAVSCGWELRRDVVGRSIKLWVPHLLGGRCRNCSRCHHTVVHGCFKLLRLLLLGWLWRLLCRLALAGRLLRCAGVEDRDGHNGDPRVVHGVGLLVCAICGLHLRVVYLLRLHHLLHLHGVRLLLHLLVAELLVVQLVLLRGHLQLVRVQAGSGGGCRCTGRGEVLRHGQRDDGLRDADADVLALAGLNPGGLQPRPQRALRPRMLAAGVEQRLVAVLEARVAGVAGEEAVAGCQPLPVPVSMPPLAMQYQRPRRVHGPDEAAQRRAGEAGEPVALQPAPHAPPDEGGAGGGLVAVILAPALNDTPHLSAPGPVPLHAAPPYTPLPPQHLHGQLVVRGLEDLLAVLQPLRLAVLVVFLDGMGSRLGGLRRGSQQLLVVVLLILVKALKQCFCETDMNPRGKNSLRHGVLTVVWLTSSGHISPLPCRSKRWCTRVHAPHCTVARWWVLAWRLSAVALRTTKPQCGHFWFSGGMEGCARRACSSMAPWIRNTTHKISK